MENLNESEQDSLRIETSENTDAASKVESTDAAMPAQTTEVVTEAQAVIKIEGQEFEIETALAQDDRLLKTILQPHFATLENANITREVMDGKLTVTIVKRAQHKGWKCEKRKTNLKHRSIFCVTSRRKSIRR